MFTRRADLKAELARMQARVAQLEAERIRGQRLDAVTGLLSPPALRAALSIAVERARRARCPLSVAAVQVDDFDALELAHGFRAGDAVLAAVARRLSATVGPDGLIGRTGHAEFTLLLPARGGEVARASLERVLIELELVGEGAARAAGASIGLAELARGMSAEGLLAEARLALRAAQASGGGRVARAPAPDGGDVPCAAPQRDAIEALAVALLERDRYTGEHSEAVIEMSAAVARNLGMSPADVERVRSAALLHDIGKVAIPDEILHKRGPLDDAEWELMRQHPVIGERILRVLPGLGAVARIVRHEHERWDGRGYPDGLAGEDIPLGSRIIIAADTYHAITSDRPYRPAQPHEFAVAELRRCAGTQFDANVTAALIGYLYGRRQAGLAAA